MKKLILASMFAGISSVAMAAVVPCTPILNALSLNPDGCTINNLLFSNFALTSAAGSFGTTGPMSFVDITIADGTVLFDLNPNQGTSAGAQRARFTFSVAGLDPSVLILGASSANGGSPATSIRQVVCTGSIDLLTGTCSGTLLQDVTNAGGTATPTTSFAGVSSVNVWRDTITPQSTTITGASFDFQATPEPVAFVLMGTGLCALALVRSRRKNKI